jgi:hypothetical protein
MSNRASRYASKERDAQSKKSSGAPLLIAYVKRTPKGKIRLWRIGIRFQGQKEEKIGDLPADDPRFVFESDYKVRKAAHEVVKRSAKFSRFYDASTRVFYGSEE